MKELSLQEQHNLLLGITKAFDKVCNDNSIPYYMLGGTMLGAIRHKGFIPWDDDMDFGVPRHYYDSLILHLENELPERYKCCTFHNSKNIVYPFIKIEDTHTKCKNGQYRGDFSDYLGINIDIFPLDSCSANDDNVKKIIWLTDKYGRVFTGAATGSKKKAMLKKIVRALIPVSQNQWYNYIETRIRKINKGNCLANLFGHWEEKEIVPEEWYGNCSRYEFEGMMLMGLKEYDKYLKQLYGNYMQLPPEEKRKCHAAGGVFLIK